MKNWIFIILLLLVSCNKDVHDYTIKELYQNDYVKDIVEKKLSFDEKYKLDKAEQRYLNSYQNEELLSKTLGELIKEQQDIPPEKDLTKITNVKLIEKNIISGNGINYLKWKIQINNTFKKDIIRVQGWLYFLDKKTKEIIRRDTVDCNQLIKVTSSIFCFSKSHEFDLTIPGDKIIQNANIENLQKSLDWEPVMITFKDSTQLSSINE
jgi:hypothetical protein